MKIIEVSIIETTGSIQREIVEDIFSRILYKDARFHFFHEIGYLLIRFEQRYKKAIKDYCIDHVLDYSFGGEWIDSHEIVRIYQKEFSLVFHANSVMALSISDIKHASRVYERSVHGVYNTLEQIFLANKIFEYEVAGWHCHNAAIMYGMRLQKEKDIYDTSNRKDRHQDTD